MTPTAPVSSPGATPSAPARCGSTALPACKSRMQKELQNKGYNDIFIPNLMVLSPTYAEYKKALDNVNDRMCRELGLYYDSNYNLVIKKDNSK